MAQKLNSMRLLEKHSIPYETIEYPDSIKNAVEVAESVGAPAHKVYKTLVVQPMAGGKPVLVMLAADCSLDLKKVAKAAGEKKVKMAPHKDAEKLTGLKVGGISALALTHKNWRVYLDSPAKELEQIIISAGQRGLQLRLPTLSLINLVRAKIADVSTN